MKSGAEYLKDWIHRRCFSQREVAAHLGFDEAFVSQLVNGKRVPGLENAIHIERLTGIPVEVWLSDDVDRSGALVAGTSRKRSA